MIVAMVRATDLRGCRRRCAVEGLKFVRRLCRLRKRRVGSRSR